MKIGRLYIEGDVIKYEDLIKTTKEHPDQITALNVIVKPTGEDSLIEIFSKLNINDLDVLSIDIDSYDYQILESLKGLQFKPKIIIIEINSAIPVGIKLKHYDQSPGYGCMGTSGSSFTSTLELGNDMSYGLVCHIGNMFFIRRDLINDNFKDIPVDSIDLYSGGC